MDQQHVGVLAFPFTSHPQTLLGLVRRLAFAAPYAKFSFFSTEKSNAFLFSTGLGICNVKPYDVAEGHAPLSGNPAEAVGFFLEAAAGNFKQAVEAAVADSGRKMTCLVTDAFLWFGAEMAEELGVPWVPFWITGLAGLSVHFHTQFIRQKIGLNAGHEEEEEEEYSEDKALDFIPGLSGIRVRDLPEEVISGDLDSVSLMLYKMSLSLPKATAVVVNSFEEINPIIATDLKSKLPKLLCLAPPTPSSSSSSGDTSDLLPWLDQQKARSVVYLSFGSILSPSPDEVVALAEALETTGVPFLWSIKDSAKESLPKGFLGTTTAGNGKLVPWAPQMKILKHPSVGVHVTHSGWNSVMESISGGVPMICRPFFADNYLNRRQVEDVWGIGMGIEGGIFTTTALLTALQQVLFVRGEKMRENIRVLQDLWRKADEPNGSSYQNFSALLDLVATV